MEVVRDKTVEYLDGVGEDVRDNGVGEDVGGISRGRLDGVREAVEVNVVGRLDGSEEAVRVIFSFYFF